MAIIGAFNDGCWPADRKSIAILSSLILVVLSLHRLPVALHGFHAD
jgi:hypothetical protein